MERERVRAETLRQRDGLAPETRVVFSRQIADSVIHWIQSEGFDCRDALSQHAKRGRNGQSP